MGMMAVVLGTLSEEDLTRWRQTTAQYQGLEMNPRAYSAQETERILVAYYRMFGEMYKMYEIAEDTVIEISPASGRIFEDTSRG